MADSLSYESVGVDIDNADKTKRAMASAINSGDGRVLNTLGAFASLVDGRFAEYKDPVLALKTEEPGSKQKLAFAHGRLSSICFDLINHLINDIIVMGAAPAYVQDCIICGKIEPGVVKELVSSMAAACKVQGCALVGGETSEQPGVIESGVYVLGASIVGVVERAKILDGSKIANGDVVLAVASNGLHTNGYTLVRAIIGRNEGTLEDQVGGETFLDAIMRPHMCYWQGLRGLFELDGLHGAAHITGGGVAGNLNRVLPAGLAASVDLGAFKILPIFKHLKDAGELDDADMIKTFNMGVGMTLVVDPASADEVIAHLSEHNLDSYPIGEITKGEKTVNYKGCLNW